MAKKKKSKKKMKSIAFTITLTVIVIAVFSFLIMKETQNVDNKVVATVNNEEITESYLESEYGKLPEQYKALIAKEDLLDQLIDRTLLFQEIEKKGIEVQDEEMELQMELIKSQFPTEEDFLKVLEEQGFTLSEVETQIKDQLVINKLLNQTALIGIEVSDKEIATYYNENQEAFQTEEGKVPFSNAKESIELAIRQQKQSEAIEEYLNELRDSAEIVILSGEEELNEFVGTEDDLCLEDEKAVIRLYTSSNCEACLDVKPAFDAAILDYEVVVKEFDLTVALKKGLPEGELELLKKYNPKGALPAYVFGCKYVRIGNAYKTLDLEKEEEEFRKVLDVI